MSKHIIEVTPATEQRHLSRRASDRSDRDKARRFDQLMADCRFQFDHWASLSCALSHGERTASVGYYEGKAHAYATILVFYGDEAAQCPCPACVHERMEAKETMLKNLSDKESCERIGKEI